MVDPLSIVRASGLVSAIISAAPGLGDVTAEQTKTQVVNRQKKGVASPDQATPGNLVGVGSTLAGIFGNAR